MWSAQNIQHFEILKEPEAFCYLSQFRSFAVALEVFKHQSFLVLFCSLHCLWKGKHIHSCIQSVVHVVFHFTDKKTETGNIRFPATWVAIKWLGWTQVISLKIECFPPHLPPPKLISKGKENWAQRTWTSMRMNIDRTLTWIHSRREKILPDYMPYLVPLGLWVFHFRRV